MTFLLYKKPHNVDGIPITIKYDGPKINVCGIPQVH